MDWSEVPGDERMRHVMSRLVETYGYPVNGAAGIVGNLLAESGVIPNRLEGSSSSTPMRARNFAGTLVDFTAEAVMNRSSSAGTGPKLPGVGLAQWTSAARRSGLFEHRFEGGRLGADIVFDMDAQIDYLDTELRTNFGAVHRVLTDPAVRVEDASDEVVYNFEVPGSVIEGGSKLPRSDARVQQVFAQRRGFSVTALLSAGTPSPVSQTAIAEAADMLVGQDSQTGEIFVISGNTKLRLPAGGGTASGDGHSAGNTGNMFVDEMLRMVGQMFPGSNPKFIALNHDILSRMPEVRELVDTE